MTLFALLPRLLLAGLLVPSLPAFPSALATSAQDPAAALRHQDPQWLSVEPFLPDPATASPQKLELAADILRARRLPEDALDFYAFALRRGGDDARISNKMGITELDLQHVERARVYFQEVVKRHRDDAQAWNNLGAVEHLQEHLRSAIYDYSRAVKLSKSTAIYHSNLASAYFAINDFESGRTEFQRALRLDPKVFERDSASGTTAHMLATGDRARFTFEMARLYAIAGDEENMLHFLAESCESGYDVTGHMGADPVLRRYVKDPRVLVLIRNARTLRKFGDALATTTPPPPLDPAK